MAVIPLMVDVAEKNIVIVGGGRVAERRVGALLTGGACLTVISPEIKEGIRSLWEDEQLNWKQKYVETEDLDGAFLIIVATNDAMVNQSVIKVSPPNSLLNVAGEADQGNVHFPAHFKQGKLSVGVSTNGASPLLSAKIKNELHTIYDESYGDYVDFLYESRQLIKDSFLDKMAQTLLLKELLSERFLNKHKQRLTVEWLKIYVGRGDKE